MIFSEAFRPTRHSDVVGNYYYKAEQVARSLKGHRAGKGWIAKCPSHDDRTASLSINDGQEGRLLLKCHSASACEFPDIISELERLGHLGANKLDRARRTLAPYVKPVPTEHTPDQRAAWLWNNSIPVHGTPAQKYLERRGILITPPSLRYHMGTCAMLAAFKRPDGKPVAVQSTFITKEGEKVTGRPPRLTYGSMRDGAVRLAAVAEIMGLAEGTETGLSAMVMSGVPVWVSLGGRRMQDVALPEFVRELHVFADNGQPGRDAAERTAEVHMRAGRRVKLWYPPAGISDFNDLAKDLADHDGDIDRLMAHLQAATASNIGSAA